MFDSREQDDESRLAQTCCDPWMGPTPRQIREVSQPASPLGIGIEDGYCAGWFVHNCGNWEGRPWLSVQVSLV